MKMKRLVALVATVAMTATVFVGCGTKGAETDKTTEGSDTKTETKTEEKAEVKVGLCTDEGGVNDKSFNQTASEGCTKAQKEFGVDYKYVESTKKEDYEPNLQGLVDNGCTLNFGVGYQLADAVKAAADQNPDAKFCLIDSTVEGSNIKSITFKEEEGSFLMGVIAGLTTKTNKVGFIGGKDMETIVKFEAGFAAGVATVNKDAAQGLISEDGKTAGKNVRYADSFADATKGKELATSLFDSDCDIIYHAAGGCGTGLFDKTKELKEQGKDVWAIGVDMDQSKSLPQYAPYILSSMMKRVDNATYDTVKEVKDGTFKAGSVVLGIAEGGVGMADSTKDNTPADTVKKAEDYQEKIKNGEIKVPATRQEVVDYVKNLK